MAIVKFADMKANHSYKSDLFIKRIDERTTQNGKTYLSLLVNDKTDDMSLQMFDTTMKDIETSGVKSETLATISIDVKENNGKTYYNVKSIVPCEDTSLKIEDFIKKAPFKPEVLYKKVIKLVESCKPENSENNTLADLTLNILEQNKERLIHWAAAKKVHGAYVGGLIFHIARVTTNADKQCELYGKALDRELMICGAALHDIGKLDELETTTTGSADYTIRGNLFGHSYLGAQYVDREVMRYNATMPKLSYNLAKVELLKHMILSHHGSYEKHAVVLPQTAEAIVLNMIDEIDSKIDQCEQATENISVGELSAAQWGLDDRRIYKHKQA